ncbi:hypothetical protein IWX46DRAFT_588274 [Phyllosticta citricarpa]|uniref:Uncharacterized protein n=1 Tax=Phyllosticta citricarpa TaxID=55181 RepID=A0ABR1MQ47_9PEZI
MWVVEASSCLACRCGLLCHGLEVEEAGFAPACELPSISEEVRNFWSQSASRPEASGRRAGQERPKRQFQAQIRCIGRQDRQLWRRGGFKRAVVEDSGRLHLPSRGTEQRHKTTKNFCNIGPITMYSEKRPPGSGRLPSQTRLGSSHTLSR